jgi:hypothetical protein
MVSPYGRMTTAERSATLPSVRPRRAANVRRRLPVPDPCLNAGHAGVAAAAPPAAAETDAVSRYISAFCLAVVL